MNESTGPETPSEVTSEATSSESIPPTPTGPQEPPPATSGSGVVTRAKPKSPQPTKVLATVRIAYPRQFDTLRAFAIASQNGQPATLGEVAPHANLTVNTLSIITSFFVASNLLTRTEGSKFMPTEASIEFERAYHWNKETAAYALGPALENTWYGQAIVNRLKMRGTISVDEAIELLASEASAAPEYKPQITTTLEWLITTGVVERDGNTLKLTRKVHFKRLEKESPTPAKPPTEKQHEVAPTGSSGTSVDEAGAITLNVAIRIDVKELMSMSADRISAFFNGLAVVVAAKGGME